MTRRKFIALLGGAAVAWPLAARAAKARPRIAVLSINSAASESKNIAAFVEGLRVLGALVVVGIGIRAVLRIVRLALAGPLRTLRVVLGSPTPSVSGPIENVLLSHVVRFGLSTLTGSVWVCAFDSSGRSVALVEIDNGHAAEYSRLCDWLGTLCPRGF